MPRKKMVIKFMEDAKKRELTYKKRSKTLIKKTSQLNTLCGVEILAVSVKPESAGAGGKREIKTWPEDRASVMALAKRFRDLSPAGIKEKMNIRTYPEGELGKEELKLVKVRQCMLDDVLTTWDRRLHDLSVDDHIALHRVLGETLERARRTMAELGSMDMDVVATSGVAATAPALQHAPAFLDNGFDLNLSEAGSSTGSQDHSYYLPPDMLPQPVPVQSNYIVFQLHMHPPCSSFPMAASSGFSFTCADINIMNRLPASWTARLYDDFAVQGSGQGFAASAAVANHQEFQSDGAALTNNQQFQSDGAALVNHQQFQSACVAVANHQQFRSFDVAMAYHQDFQSSSFDAAGTGAGAYGFDAARSGAGTGDGSYGFAAGTGAGAYGFDAAESGAGTVDGSYGFAAGTVAGAYGFDAIGSGTGTVHRSFGRSYSFTAGTRAGAYGFDVVGSGARYELEPNATGVWPLGTPNNPVDAAAYQLQNDTVLWPDNGVGQLGLGEQEGTSRLPRFDGWI